MLLSINLVNCGGARAVVFRVTPGNVADNNHQLMDKLTARLEGFLYGDAGYITSLKQTLQARGLELITKLRDNMKPGNFTPNNVIIYGIGA